MIRAPHVIRSRAHAEMVLAMRNVGVISHTPRTRFGPLVFVAFQHVAELHLLWRDKARRSELDFEVALTRRNHNRLVEQSRFVIDKYPLYNYLRTYFTFY